MRGFQPGKARAVPQNYADGGVVSTIKGMLGFGGGKKKPEPLPADLNKMPPTGAGPAASQPEPPKKAISQYSGMSALERRMKEQGLADGGLVRGPGTGISDDIEDEVEEGTFVMPADSTEAIGPDTMDQLGKADVPVNLSNGEAKLPPEALQAIGAQVMEAIKDVTHVPAAKQARGFPMGDQARPEIEEDGARLNFADGGVVGKKRLYLADAGLATQERLKREGMTIADRARQPGFSMGAAARTTQPTAQSAPVAQQPSAQAALPASPPSAQAVTPPAVGAAPTQAAVPAASESTVRRDRGMPAASTQSKPLPAGWATDGERFMPGVQNVWNESGKAIGDLVGKGRYGAAVGETARAAASYVPALADDTFGGAYRAIAPGVIDATKQFFGFGDDGAIAASPSAPSASPATPAANNPAPAQAAVQAKPDASKPNPQPTQTPTPTGAREIAPGIFRQGNSFGDSAAAAAAGAQPSQGPSARDMQAMNNLIARDPVAGAMDRALGVERDPAQAATGFSQGGARQAPAAAPASAAESSAAPAATTARGFQPAGQSAQPGGSPMEMYARQAEAMRGLTEAQRALDQYGPGSSGQGGGTYIKHSGNDWETEKNLKNLRTSASSITNRPGRRGEPSVEQQAYLKALDADMAARSGNNPAAIEAMRQQGETARIGMREAGENARSGRREGLAAELGRGQLDLQRSAQGFTTRQAARQEKLYEELDAAKTPEEQAAVSRKIAAAAGKTTDPKDNFMVVGGGQEWDAAAGAMRNVPQRLVDLRTVQDVGATGQGGKPLPAPADPKERKVGSVYVAPNGANVRWTGQGWQQA